jgi:predicted NBD/HSP70 family sugar kinase
MRPSTIQNILKNLETNGMVLKIGTGDSTKLGGRRPTLWKIRGKYGYVIGIEMEINEIEVVLVDFNSQIVDNQHIITKRFKNLGEIEDIVNRTIVNMLAANKIDNDSLLGIGIAVSGLVDIGDGCILKTSLLGPVQQPIYLQKSLEKHFDVPIYIENDANAAVVAEKWFGNVNGIKNIIYTLIVVGTDSFGIGFGLILNNEVYRGTNMFAGETESFTLNIKKILKTKCGFKGDEIVVDGKSMDIGDLQIHHLIKILENKNECAIRFFKEVGNIVGEELVKVINMLDPGMIIIGGEILGADKYLLDPIRRRIQEKMSQVVSRKTAIMGSSLSQNSVALGGATIVLKRIFQDPLIAGVGHKTAI